jgi:hypothetical protein
MSAMPADADTLCLFPLDNVCPHRINTAGNFVPGDARVLDTWPMSLFDEGVTVANAACFDPDAHLVSSGFRDRTFDQFKVSAGFGDLYRFHGCHMNFLE